MQFPFNKQTNKHANLSSKPRLYSFVLTQFESGLLYQLIVKPRKSLRKTILRQIRYVKCPCSPKDIACCIESCTDGKSENQPIFMLELFQNNNMGEQGPLTD